MEPGELVRTAGTRQRIIVALGAALAFLVAHVLDPSVVATGPVLCPFRRLTGIPCPGCGMTRAAIALAHADVRGALELHPLSPLAAVGALAVLGTWFWRGRCIPIPLPVLVLLVVVVLGTWLLRLPSFISGQVVI